MKFLVFHGAWHHLERMRPVIEILRGDGHDIDIVTAQHPWCNHRSDVEQAVRGSGFPYRFLADSNSSPAFHARVAKARRSMSEGLFKAFRDPSPAPWFSPEWRLSYLVQEAVEHRTCCELLLEEARPHAVLVLHENNFWARGFAAAASELSIPVFSFQDGLLSDRLPDSLLREHGIYSTCAFLWGDLHKERFESAGLDGGKLIVTGPPHLDAVLPRRGDRTHARERMGLAPTQPSILLVAPDLATSGFDPGFVQALLDWFERRPDVAFLVKWREIENHADRNTFNLRATSLLGNRFHGFVAEDPYEAVLAADCVLGFATTLAAEAMALDRPVLEIAWNREGPEPVLGLSEKAGIPAIKSEADFALLDASLAGDLPKPAQRDAWLRRCFSDLDGHASKRCCDAILGHLAARSAP